MDVLAEILFVAALALAAARFAPPPWRRRAFNALKIWVTVRAFWLLLVHRVALEDGSQIAAWRLIADQLKTLDAASFWPFVALAAGIKFIGILSSMLRWLLLLRGQGIELPFRHIFGSFLIGRFIGTFLPSTAGLDGYKLYDAARWSGRTLEVAATTLLEKVLGISGIFLCFLVALPFGMKIFGGHATLIAAFTVPIAVGIIGGLLLLLWYPKLVEWLILHLPLPAKAHLSGLLLRVARAAAAYRHHRWLVPVALLLSFLVHFTTAAMYYFTALAIGAEGAAFWPIVFGSSIQIFATVMSPITIAGEGIREAAQYLLLGNLIGPAEAIVSAALGFWAAEALTLFGGVIWWLRSSNYRPAFCHVHGEQVDYAAAARTALTFTESGETATAIGALPFSARVRSSASAGLSTGLLAGVFIGAGEAVVIALTGFGEEAQVLWYGPAAYALVMGVLGALVGAGLAALPLDARETRGWPPTLVLLGLFLPAAAAIALFRLRRDAFLEQALPFFVLVAIAGGTIAAALFLFVYGPRIFANRLSEILRTRRALLCMLLVIGGGGFVSVAVAPTPPPPITPPAIPPALLARPNLILIMVDTLRADHLSCYGNRDVKTPNLCQLAADGDGTRYTAFSHASWTKPAAATLLSSLLPSSHGAMSKTAVLPEAVALLPEVLREHGYRTGGIVSNINLAPSFGFAQGYDEYLYLGPDYLAGARESSSKSILYQILRKVFFKFSPGLRPADFYQDSAVVNRVAFKWLERHRDARFFLFLHYMDPHDPYFVHPYDGRGVARVSTPHPNPERAQELKDLYRGEIEYLDANVGTLLSKLRELGLFENALIALTSDHGEEFNEHGGFWHGLTLYEEQIHVPLLIKWPAGLANTPPAAATRLAGLLDVAPTLLRSAGVAVPAAMQGEVLLGSAAAAGTDERSVFAEENHEGNVLRAVRTPRWKWVEANPGNPRGLPERELFDLTRDPQEQRNLHTEAPKQAQRLATRAEAEQRAAARSAVEPHSKAALSRAECERLAALGYVRAEDCARRE